MATVDLLKTALASAAADSAVRIEVGGTIFQLTVAELAKELSVSSAATSASSSTKNTKRVLVSSDFLRIRAKPSTTATEVGRLNKGEIVEVDDIAPVSADGYTWLLLSDGRGYVAMEFTKSVEESSYSASNVPPAAGSNPSGSGVKVLSTSAVTSTPSTSTSSTPPTQPRMKIPTISWVPPFSASMRGVGGSAGGWSPDAKQLDLVRKNNIEVVFIAAYEPGQAAKAIPAFRDSGVKHFVVRAAMHEAVTTAERFVALTLPTIEEYANALGTSDGLMVQVHNEVNLVKEGWTTAWADGTAFADWYLDVANAYRQALTGVKIGYPALSPGGDVPEIRLSESTFLQQSTVAIQDADWVGVHYYWERRDGSDINPLVGNWRMWFGNKPLVGTEVGPADNNSATADAVRIAYEKFAAIGVPAMAWILNGAGAWQNAAWDLNNIYL